MWLGVIIVGLFAGLIGGGIALGINNLVQHHEEVTSTRVPAGSNRSGGTKVNKNKADLSGEASQAYKSVQGAVVSVINKQKVQQSSGTQEFLVMAVVTEATVILLAIINWKPLVKGQGLFIRRVEIRLML